MTVPALSRSLSRQAVCLLPLVTLPLTAHAEAPTLSLPVACQLRKTCFIQNYVDVDASAAAKDYRCGGATYDGHKGTDFRLLSTRAARAGVEVLAAADGVVKALRDGMSDRLLGADKSSVRGRECGNGIVIEHGEGWETQYCHLLEGSVRVRKGQRVRRGEPVGLVGYSGMTQFAHLHLSVRHHGKTIDPFSGLPPGKDGCERRRERSLWQPDLRAALAYRDGEILAVGFSSRPVTTKDLEIGDLETARPSPGGAALVFYARFMNAQPGDRYRLRLSGPEGVIASNVTKPLPRHKAGYVAYVGRKRRGDRWAAGVYEGAVQVIRDGKVVHRRQSRLRLR